MSFTAARINGVPSTSMDPDDRGLFYGDGVFRTVRVMDGMPRGWRYQYHRLMVDCQQLCLPCPSAAELIDDIDALFADGGDGIAKLVITRGAGGRGYAPPAACEPTRLVLRYPAPRHPVDYVQVGVAVGIAETRLARQPALAGAKHLNRLEQVFARRECTSHGWPEALMCTDDGRVISGTMSNLFVARGGALLTPRIRDAGVKGATRDWLMAGFAETGDITVEADLSLSDITGADEAFLCNSVMPIWPIRRIAKHRIALGSFSRRAQSLIEQEQR